MRGAVDDLERGVRKLSDELLAGGRVGDVVTTAVPEAHRRRDLGQRELPRCHQVAEVERGTARTARGRDLHAEGQLLDETGHRIEVVEVLASLALTDVFDGELTLEPFRHDV